MCTSNSYDSVIIIPPVYEPVSSLTICSTLVAVNSPESPLTLGRLDDDFIKEQRLLLEKYEQAITKPLVPELLG